MTTAHAKILEEFHKSAGTASDKHDLLRYLGSTDRSYFLRVPDKRRILKQFAREHTNISFEEFRSLLDDLYASTSHEEKCAGGDLLLFFPHYRIKMSPTDLDRWLSSLHGWNQIDCLCQNVFKYDQLLQDWGSWKKMLTTFSKSSAISKRRASLVLLTGPVSYSDDPRLADQAFATIRRLQHEKDILITKAISWLLRSLLTFHRVRVIQYIQAQEAVLPSIAVRETKKKLMTGKKT